MNILKAWNAGFVRRWHTQPIMVETDDRDDGHQHRCTVLLLLFFPDSTREAIIDCIIHDQGEIETGDMAHPTKKKYPELAMKIGAIERQEIRDQGFTGFRINSEEYSRRGFVDLLDSYLWMLRHYPRLAKRPEWVAQYQTLVDWSREHKIEDKFDTLMSEADDFYVQ